MQKLFAAFAAVFLFLTIGHSSVSAGGLPSDLNGDGKADLLWFNPATGQTSYWTMSGGTMTGSGVLLADPNWRIIAIADLNGDGKSDLIWFNPATGQTSYWLMNGGAPVSSGLLLTDSNWKVVATGDLNGDGKTDLIWHNAVTGQTSYWLMNGPSVLASGLLLTDPIWTVVAAGDINGDGKADLFWYNRVTGQTSVWLMNGGAAVGYSVLLANASWNIAALADLNGDGQVDIVWINAATGQTAYWLMSGATVLSTGQLLLDPNWRVINAIDLDGDGKTDLVWFNAATGQTSYWLMNSGALKSAAVLLTHSDWTPSPAAAPPPAIPPSPTGVQPIRAGTGVVFLDLNGDYGAYFGISGASDTPTRIGTSFGAYARNDPVGHTVSCFYAFSAGVGVEGYAYAININHELIRFDPAWTAASKTPPCEYLASVPPDAGSATIPNAQVSVTGNAVYLLKYVQSTQVGSMVYRYDLATKAFTQLPPLTYNGQTLSALGISVLGLSSSPNGDLTTSTSCSQGGLHCGFIQDPTGAAVITINPSTGAVRTVTPISYFDSSRRDFYVLTTAGDRIYGSSNYGLLISYAVDASGTIFALTGSPSASLLDIFRADGRLVRTINIPNAPTSSPGGTTAVFYKQ